MPESRGSAAALRNGRAGADRRRSSMSSSRRKDPNAGIAVGQTTMTVLNHQGQGLAGRITFGHSAAPRGAAVTMSKADANGETGKQDRKAWGRIGAAG